MDINNRPDHIEDYLTSLHSGQWFGWSDSKNKVYANIVIHPKIQDESNDTIDNPHSKPTEQQCIDGLAALKTAFDDAKTKVTSDKTSGNNKLKALGLTDDEITAITKG
jgi:acetyl-CoA acetyltransferase